MRNRGQLLRKSANSTEERVRSPIFVSSVFSERRGKGPAVTPQKEELFQEGRTECALTHRKGVRLRREEGSLAAETSSLPGSPNREHRRKEPKTRGRPAIGSSAWDSAAPARPEGAWPRAPPASTLAGACLPHVLRLVASSAPAW